MFAHITERVFKRNKKPAGTAPKKGSWYVSPSTVQPSLVTNIALRFASLHLSRFSLRSRKAHAELTLAELPTAKSWDSVAYAEMRAIAGDLRVGSDDEGAHKKLLHLFAVFRRYQLNAMSPDRDFLLIAEHVAEEENEPETDYGTPTPRSSVGSMVAMGGCDLDEEIARQRKVLGCMVVW